MPSLEEALALALALVALAFITVPFIVVVFIVVQPYAVEWR